MRPWATAAAAALALLLAAVPAQAQKRAKPSGTPPAAGDNSASPPRQFDDWKVGCERSTQGDGQVCFAFQMLQHETSKRTLGYISIGYPAAGKSPLAILNLPLGMLIPSGAVLQVDGVSVKADAPIKVCYAEGCRAELPFSAAMVAAFRQQATARVAFMNLDESLIELPISLKGFTAAFDSLK
jgi:invasion protein IalB